jgi:hypothetical protein
MTQRKLPTPEDDRDRKVLADIAKLGWTVIGVEADDEGPAFAFSVGLFHTLAHPEVLIMGLRPQIAHRLINDIGAAIRNGERFVAGQQYGGIAAGFPLAFVEVDRRYYREYLGYAGWFYGGPDFPVLQCVWPDKQGVFPWQPGYDSHFFQLQRVLGGDG